MKNNQIEINDSQKLIFVQDKFTSLFPFLRLEFYDHDTDDSHPANKRIKVLNGTAVGDCRLNHNAGVITVFPEMSVLDLQEIFFKSFGISLIVLRKAGNIWQKTNHTDSWSLEEQNRQGEIVSNYMNKQEEKRKGQ